MGVSQRDKGLEAEEAAVLHLESRGYSILARNLRVGRNEIDILAVDPESRTVVIVEVKSRVGSSHRPEERVDIAKQRAICSVAERLSTRRELHGATFRFDVIAVAEAPEGRTIMHWPAAFEHGGR